MKRSWREGKFKTWARYGGVLNVVVTITICIFWITSMLIEGPIIITIACLIGILELPFCCTSLTICKSIQPYMTIFETYWIRGLLYVLLGVLTYIITGFIGGMFGYIAGTAFILDGALYILAHVRGETHTAADNTVEGLGVNTTRVKAKLAATAMGIV
eukprot:CAMPEP_0180140860 /NCGR_PEP_ID=MMETSP0986-20121125/14509_1 /TAXON_ID=697907 /ORGANISM="non described non described, Strain CCMP2293" /LENGTH=157 /DNA_ID=CAMNT_0022083493 /DNA_START=177 /DNA_END=650 /DNA_ORIENTATION=+